MSDLRHKTKPPTTLCPFSHLYNGVGHRQHKVVSSVFKVLFLFLFQKGYYKQLGKLLQNFTETKTTANGDSVKVENGKDHNNDDSVENGSNGSSNNGHHDNKQETNGSNGSIEQCDNDCHDNTKETNGSLPSIDDKIKKNENQEEVTEDNNENKRETIEITEDNENKRETTTKKNDDQKVGWYRIFPMRLGLVFNATFNNISVLLVGETGVPRENHVILKKILPDDCRIIIIPLVPEGGGILFYLCPSVQEIFCHIFLSNC